MTAKGIYINVSRRNEDIPEFIEEIRNTEQFQELSMADTVCGILHSYPKLINYKRRCHQLEKQLEELGVAH
tara:strand:+ start:63 stop:275 length:213 start_codon:yes stop_codon:yes gene_type:complete